MLRYTGHPLVDVGVATIVAWSKKHSPQELTEKDLEVVADALQDYLFESSPFQVYLLYNGKNALPAQSYYNPPKQPAHDASKPDWEKYRAKLENYQKNETEIVQRKREYLARVLQGYRRESIGETCAFSGHPAVDIVYRTQIPLLNGEEAINFSGRGRPGIPICGWCLLAIHAAPMGSVKSGGRVLSVHTDDKGLLLRFARHGLQTNQAALSLVSQDPQATLYNLTYTRTRFVELLSSALTEQEMHEERSGNLASISAYHITNYGPDPKVDIYHLPNKVVEFLREVNNPASQARPAWRYYTWRAWDVRKNQTTEEIASSGAGRNFLYENLFTLPASAPAFIRSYLTPGRAIEAWQNMPQGSWTLIGLFLRKVVNMDSKRVEAIRRMGDRLAAYIQNRDRKLFNEMHFARQYHALRLALVRAARDGWSPDGEPLLPMDLYIQVFEEGDNEFADLGWRLSRDVLMIRICEELQRSGWFDSNRDYIETIQEPETENEE